MRRWRREGHRSVIATIALPPRFTGHALGAAAVVEQLDSDFDLIVEGVGGATFGRAIEHLAPRGLVVSIATESDDGTVTFRASRFSRAPGATIYTLNLFDELAEHASATSELTRLCSLIVDGRLDGQVELEGSWRQAARAIDALLHRRIGGKAVLHVDEHPRFDRPSPGAFCAYRPATWDARYRLDPNAEFEAQQPSSARRAAQIDGYVIVEPRQNVACRCAAECRWR